MIGFWVALVVLVGASGWIGYGLGYTVGGRDEARRMAQELRELRQRLRS